LINNQPWQGICQLRGDHVDAREVAARPGETGDETPLDRVAAEGGDDRDRRGRVFGRTHRSVAAGGRDHINFAGDEIGGQSGQPIKATVRPTVFDRHVLALDIAGCAKAPLEGDDPRGHRLRATCC
jgi:hypothetical protein